jgi:hypothetical protein
MDLGREPEGLWGLKGMASAKSRGDTVGQMYGGTADALDGAQGSRQRQVSPNDACRYQGFSPS